MGNSDLLPFSKNIPLYATLRQMNPVCIIKPFYNQRSCLPLKEQCYICRCCCSVPGPKELIHIKHYRKINSKSTSTGVFLFFELTTAEIFKTVNILAVVLVNVSVM